MTHKIPNSCFGCGICLPQCPTQAIDHEEDFFWINEEACNDCQNWAPQPLCVVQCPISSPLPLRPKKGRPKKVKRLVGSLDLFSNGKHSPFASSMVIWEGCKLLSGATTLPWQKGEQGSLLYQRQVKQGRGQLNFRLLTRTSRHHLGERQYISQERELEDIDLRAACLHLIYAAYAMTVERPWEETFVIDDQQIESYLGLERRKDLSKGAKLTLIKSLVRTACRVRVELDWPRQGKIPAFSREESPLWHLVETQHHFQEDSQGSRQLIGLTFQLRAGIWSKYFLNRQGYRQRTAFYQYGTLPKFVLSTVMSIWQQHPGAVRILLWLLFKAKMGRKQRLTTSTLMQVAYGQEMIEQATLKREHRKRLIQKFEGDLEILTYYGVKAIFDPTTYPREIQPLWAKIADLPDDAEEALEFWLWDGTQAQSLTDAAPRGKWTRLLKAHITRFEFPKDWEEQLDKFERQKTKKKEKRSRSKSLNPSLSSERIVAARKKQGYSQRELAQRLGKSQSWIRDIEGGRFGAKEADQRRLKQVLKISY